MVGRPPSTGVVTFLPTPRPVSIPESDESLGEGHRGGDQQRWESGNLLVNSSDVRTTTGSVKVLSDLVL